MTINGRNRPRRTNVGLRTTSLAAGLLLFFSANSGFAAGAYWTRVPTRPQYIVVGIMSGVAESSCEDLGRESVYGSRIVRVFDTGFIDVREILYGQDVPERIPVSWLARCRYEPAIADLRVEDADVRRFCDGDLKVWGVGELRDAKGAARLAAACTACAFALCGCTRSDERGELVFCDSFESSGDCELKVWTGELDGHSVRPVPSTCPGGGKRAVQLAPDASKRPKPLPDWIETSIAARLEGLEEGDVVEYSAWIRRDDRTRKGQGHLELQVRSSDCYTIYRQEGKNFSDDARWRRISVRQKVPRNGETSLFVVLRAYGPPGCAICFDRVEVRRLEAGSGES